MGPRTPAPPWLHLRTGQSARLNLVNTAQLVKYISKRVASSYSIIMRVVLGSWRMDPLIKRPYSNWHFFSYYCASTPHDPTFATPTTNAPLGQSDYPRFNFVMVLPFAIRLPCGNLGGFGSLAHYYFIQDVTSVLQQPMHSDLFE